MRSQIRIFTLSVIPIGVLLLSGCSKPSNNTFSAQSENYKETTNFSGTATREPDVIYVPTPPEVVDKMLELAQVKKTDLVYDLGCGDGRIVITAAKKYGCKAVGYDIDPHLVIESRKNVEINKLSNLVTVEQKDIFTLDLSNATVITLYLLPSLNVKLIPQLEMLKPGSRIVSHDFDMKGVIPDQVVTIPVSGSKYTHTVYLWTTPLNRTNTGQTIYTKVEEQQQTEKVGIPSTLPLKVEEKILEPSQSRNPLLWTPGARQTLWVLAVGVGQYKNSQVPALPFAKKDAERLQDWFVNLESEGLTRDNVHVLFDEQATRENLLNQIDWLRKQALPEDAIIVYFAGHGAPELASDGMSVDAKYLVLYDTDPSQLFSTGFPLDDLMRKLDTVKAKTQVVILEACYAGPVGQEILKKTPTADLEIRPRLIQQLGEKGGRVILSASSGRQMAIGSDTIQGSLFTYYLLEAWGDGSQRLLSDRFEDAIYQVRRESNRLGSYQEPAKYGDQNIDMILKVR